MEKERNYKLDCLKFFLIFGVVFGHFGWLYAEKDYTLGALCFWIYTFHMPAFVFVSGLLSKQTIRERRWYKFVPYLILYFIMKAIENFRIMLCTGEAAPWDFFHEDFVAWYAFAMFWLFLVTTLVRNVKPLYVLIVSLVIAVISGYSPKIDSFLVIQRSINFFPFFYAGYLLDVDKLLEFLKKKWVIITSILLLTGIFAACMIFYNELGFWQKLFRGRFSYEMILGNYSFGGLWRAFAYVLSFALTFALLAVMPNRKSIFSTLGGRTLPVYMLHAYIQLALNDWPWFREWFLSSHVALKSLVGTVILVAVLSLKPLESVTRMIMNVPMLNSDRETAEKKV